MSRQRSPLHPSLARAALSSPVLLFLLAGLYPSVFLESLNWFAYTADQLTLLVLVVPAATLTLGSAALGLALPAARALLRTLAPNRAPVDAARLRTALTVLIAAPMFAFLLQATLFSEYDPLWYSLSLAAASTGVLALIAVRWGLLPLCLPLAIMAALAAGSWVFSVHEAGRRESGAWHEADRGLVSRLRFERRPNVYLVHLESYHSPEAMRDLYGFENREFQEDLRELGFTVFENQFSNYDSTLVSLAALFGMRHHYLELAVGSHDALGARDLIGGKAFNPVLEAFLSNGYRCQIVHPGNYAFIAGDRWEFVHPPRRPLGVLAIFRSGHLDRMLEAIPGRAAAGAGYETLLRERVENGARGKGPSFSFLQPHGLDHSPTGRKWTELQYWEREYPRRVEAANPGYLGLVGQIVEADPAAVVLMYGDHGAWRYRGVWGGPRELSETLADAGVAPRALALDLFGTFLAVRYPGGDAARFEGVTHVNLFRTLFADLSDDEEILADAPGDDAFLARNLELWAAVRDGRALDTWQLVEREAGRR